MDLGLKDKVVLVAAASTGLGYGIARALAAEGARVSICSRDREAVHAAAEQIAADFGVQALPFACDVLYEDQIAAWVKFTTAQWGESIHGLVANAGGPPSLVLHEASDAQWLGAFELTLLSTVHMIRAALPHMENGSAILTVTSSTTKEPVAGLGLSTVMRAGVVGMVKVYADELAPRGIRVNNLAPGRILTDRIVHLDQINATRSQSTVEEVRAKSEAAVPLKRLGTIDEFGRAAAFLLSPAASYTTGATLRVDGGAMRSIGI